MEAFCLCQVMSWFFFIYPLKYLTEDLRPQSIPRGSCYQFCRSQPAKSNASFRRHYLDFLALFPLRNFTLPDGLTTRWQVDCYVTSVGNLERIDSENICPWHKIKCVYTQNIWFSGTFSGAQDSFNLKKKKIHELKISVTVCWILQSKRNKLSE